jgi:hypothetical protein
MLGRACGLAALLALAGAVTAADYSGPPFDAHLHYNVEAFDCQVGARPGLTCGGGKLCPEWRELLLKYPERFMIGSDTWVNQRWADYDRLMQGCRAWLGDLPPTVAHRIAWDNGARLFGAVEK